MNNAKPGRHRDGQGLYLLVSNGGSKSWVLRVQVDGRRRDIGLGPLSTTSLAEAREKCLRLRKAAKLGRDPIAERDREKLKVVTFAEAVGACHEAQKRGWRGRHAEAFLASLRQHAFPRLGKLHVNSIDERDIVAVLTPLWHDKPAAARKLRQRIGTVLDFSKGSGWRVVGSPRESLRTMLSKQAKPGNFAAMPYDKVPKFVAELRAKPNTVGRMALLFTILTAARSGEVRSARWSHIDLDAKTWSRPGALMKSGAEHVVTLSDSVISVLAEAAKLRTTTADCLVFPGTGGRMLSDMTLLKIVKSDGTGYTVHGFRASFRTWAAIATWWQSSNQRTGGHSRLHQQ